MADSNIVAPAVHALREAGHDVTYAGERAADPGDAALLAEAAGESRTFLTKDHDIGMLIHRDGHAHCGVLLLDDLGDARSETSLIMAVLGAHGDRLASGTFLLASPSGVREASASA